MPRKGESMPAEQRQKIADAQRFTSVPEFKRCPECGETKPSSEFKLRKSPRLSGFVLHAYCVECTRPRARKPSSDTPRPTALERFVAKVSKDENGCWVWTAATNGRGYGKFTPRPRVYVYAHRWSYEHFVGPIPPGLVIDHLCRNRSCVNPEHLEVVTTAENLFRGEHPSHKAARTDVCKRGHSLKGVPRNKHGWRRCPVCHALLTRERSKRGAQ